MLPFKTKGFVLKKILEDRFFFQLLPFRFFFLAFERIDGSFF